MKPGVTLVAIHTVSESNLNRIARELGTLCDSPPWKISLHNSTVTTMPVYCFTSTRKNVPLSRFIACKAYVDGVQFGMNHA